MKNTKKKVLEKLSQYEEQQLKSLNSLKEGDLIREEASYLVVRPKRKKQMIKDGIKVVKNEFKDFEL